MRNYLAFVDDRQSLIEYVSNGLKEQIIDWRESVQEGRMDSDSNEVAILVTEIEDVINTTLIDGLRKGEIISASIDYSFSNNERASVMFGYSRGEDRVVIVQVFFVDEKGHYTDFTIYDQPHVELIQYILKEMGKPRSVRLEISTEDDLKKMEPE